MAGPESGSFYPKTAETVEYRNAPAENPNFDQFITGKQRAEQARLQGNAEQVASQREAGSLLNDYFAPDFTAVNQPRFLYKNLGTPSATPPYAIHRPAPDTLEAVVPAPAPLSQPVAWSPVALNQPAATPSIPDAKMTPASGNSLETSSETPEAAFTKLFGTEKAPNVATLRQYTQTIESPQAAKAREYIAKTLNDKLQTTHKPNSSYGEMKEDVKRLQDQLWIKKDGFFWPTTAEACKNMTKPKVPAETLKAHETAIASADRNEETKNLQTQATTPKNIFSIHGSPLTQEQQEKLHDLAGGVYNGLMEMKGTHEITDAKPLTIPVKPHGEDHDPIVISPHAISQGKKGFSFKDGITATSLTVENDRVSMTGLENNNTKTETISMWDFVHQLLVKLDDPDSQKTPANS